MTVLIETVWDLAQMPPWIGPSLIGGGLIGLGLALRGRA